MNTNSYLKVEVLGIFKFGLRFFFNNKFLLENSIFFHLYKIDCVVYFKFILVVQSYFYVSMNLSLFFLA